MKIPKIMPGPWKKIGPSMCDRNYAITAVAGKFVAEVFYQNDFHVHNTAEITATAIAALPDLLDALIEVRRALELANFTGELAVVDAALLKAGCTDA